MHNLTVDNMICSAAIMFKTETCVCIILMYLHCIINNNYPNIAKMNTLMTQISICAKTIKDTKYYVEHISSFQTVVKWFMCDEWFLKLDNQ